MWRPNTVGEIFVERVKAERRGAREVVSNPNA